MDASVTNWLEWFEQLRSYVRSLPITVFYVYVSLWLLPSTDSAVQASVVARS